jgi:hypothetical protein
MPKKKSSRARAATPWRRVHAAGGVLGVRANINANGVLADANIFVSSKVSASMVEVARAWK